MKEIMQGKAVAVVGAGPVGFGFVNEILHKVQKGERLQISSIDIFDKYGQYGMGAGLPYDMESTDVEHLLNVNAISTSQDFTQWLKDNQDELKEKMHGIFDQRLDQKFQQRFGKAFHDYDALEGEELALKNHYDALWSSIEKRYLDLENGATYHPRVLVGLYNIGVFDDTVKALRQEDIEVYLHPHSEITDVTKIETGGAQLHFNGEAKSFSDVIMSTGRWRVKSDVESPQYIPEVWPIAHFQERFDDIVLSEKSRRKSEGDVNREMRVAIQGSSLTAIDALKTICKEGLFEENEQGGLTFTPYDEDGYVLKVDLLSRSGVTQQVKGKDSWLRDKHNGKFPQGTEITQPMMEELAASQDQKVRLWQVMLVLTRALENAYRLEEEEDKANVARDFSKLILAQVNKTEAGAALLADETQTNAVFDGLAGSSLSQLQQLQEQFGLQLDGCHYQPIIDQCKAMFFGLDTMDQLRENNNNAKHGDIEGGYLLWKNIYGQLDSLWNTWMKLLTPEESAYRLQVLDRYMESTHNGMPIQTADELLALSDAGVLNFVKLGANAPKPYEQDGKIVFESQNGDCLAYDAVINTMGYSVDVARNPSLMVSSMLQKGYLKVGETLFAGSDAEFEAKKEDVCARFGQEESQRMLKRVSCHEEDGKYYYSTGGYLRSADLAVVDQEGNNLLPGVVFPGSGGVITARNWGVRVANSMFPSGEVTLQRDSNKSVEKLDGSSKANHTSPPPL